jgi:hypothetical protein
MLIELEMKKPKMYKENSEESQLLFSYLNTVLIDFDSEDEIKKIMKHLKPSKKPTRNK